MDVPSMVQRSGDTLIVRSVVSGDQIFLDQETGKIIKQNRGDRYERFQASVSLDGLPADMSDELDGQAAPKDEGLPQCKIKRNYSCNSCTFFTQNPRYFLTHLRDVHGEKIVINECKLCLYASRHYQKLVRHMKMVHGSTEGIEDHAQARKRQLGREGRKRRIENSAVNVSPAHHRVAAQSPAKFDDLNPEDTPQNRLLKCSLCEFTTLYRAQLVEHERDEHYKTKFFRCEKCTYVTHIKARFSKHVKYHSMPMIKCVTCDFRTPYKWNLDRHMKNHGGTGTFKCAACNFTADIKQSLTVHEMNHHVPPVGHAAGMSMARRKNKVGGTDIVDDFMSENGDLEDSLNNNNNNIEDLDESLTKRYKYGDEEQPTDLSQKPNKEQNHQQKKVMRPIPNLIPIQSTGNALNLSKQLSSFVAHKELHPEKATLTELASYFFGPNKVPEILGSDRVEPPQLSPSSNSSTTSKKKGTSFFDRLKETLALDAARNENLICGCGYTAKCLSESIIHRNTCQKDDSEEKRSSPSPINLSVNSGSTRCQFCRHRCKSSADLVSHIRNCIEAGQCQNDSYDSLSDINERLEDDGTDEATGETSTKHPMENRIFVWNKMPNVKTEGGLGGDRENLNADGDDDKKQISVQCGENGYYGVETAPGYGEVTKKMTSEEEAANSSLKKVYKCPHCAFWASTASRFHVHIVGHLNKKPFECSFCSYRSNWRWDITKHIRLKTIRDPNHKVARVLMNDETGRRNYTKYNKYITLMKVTEEDGDPKLLKSGEMTPHQEASLALLNEFNNSIQKSKLTENQSEESKQNDCGTSQVNNIMAMDPNRFMRLPFFAPSIMRIVPPQQEQQQHQQDPGNRSPNLLIKPTEEVLTQNIDMKPDGSEKKTLYKCRKCNYRNPNRDMVLSHVKGHYQEAGINLTQKSNLTTPLQVAVNSNLYVNNVLAAMCLSQTLGDKTGKHQHHPLLAGSLAQPPVQTAASFSQSIPNAPSPTILPLNLGMATKVIEHGEADEASSGVVATSGTGVTGWRSPAPYRCGHCHQVSNWKHVIQRHCRLKHNSDIRIETVDRNSNKNSPVYHPLLTQSTSNGSNVLSSNTSYSQSTKISCKTNQETLTSQISTKPQTSVSNYDDQSVDPKSAIFGTSISIRKDSTSKDDIEDVIKSIQKHQQCPSCPFVSESKSQMNYHVSLHKNQSETYECLSCTFVASKKQHLNHHSKVVHGEDQIENEAVDLRANNIIEVDIFDKSLLFCQECPARYIGSKDFTLHIKLHGVELPYRCNKCNYSTRQEYDLRSHTIVHSSVYQEKTEKLCIKFKTTAEYPRPQIVQACKGQDVWIVDRSYHRSSSDLEDSIQKNIIRIDECNRNQESSYKSLLKAQLESGEKSGTKELCSDCPFETDNILEYKKHIQGHERISGRNEKFKCFACDFSTLDEVLHREHAKLHIQPIMNSKSVDYYTSFKSLELNLVNSSESADKQIENLYRSDNEKMNENCDDQEISSPLDLDCTPGHRIILDAKTGEIISKYEPSSPGSS